MSASSRWAVSTRAAASRSSVASSSAIRRCSAELGGFCAREEPAACAPIVAAFRAHGTWQVPALAIERDLTREEMAGDPRLAYMPPSLVAYWFGAGAWPPGVGGEIPAAAPAPGARELPEEAWLTRLLREAGVPILAGTDAGVPFSLPGWSLHDELALLVAAGLRPVEALAAATRGPAEYLGRGDRLGTIAVGRSADLVLLRHDPLEDIRHTRAIEAVILRGELLDRAALDAVLADVRRMASGESGRADGR